MYAVNPTFTIPGPPTDNDLLEDPHDLIYSSIEFLENKSFLVACHCAETSDVIRKIIVIYL